MRNAELMGCMLCMSMFASMVNMGVKVLVNRTVDSNGEHGCVMSMCEHGCHELRSNTKTPSVFWNAKHLSGSACDVVNICMS